MIRHPTKRVRRWFFTTAVVLYVLAPLSAAALDLAAYPEVTAFIDEMVARHGLTRSRLERAFTQAYLQPRVIQAMERPKESLAWVDYKKLFVTEDHARRGYQYWRTQRAALARAERTYGVPPEIILAILGVETGYGQNAGDFVALAALTTLALYHPPRARFFREELEQLLLLARDLRLDPMQLIGSYAGALGIPQFMPSSYRRFAVDFDGDRKPDLLGNHVDAIGSIANFLRAHGWERDGPIMDDARITGAVPPALANLGIEPALSVAEFIAYGISPRSYGASDSGKPTPHGTPDSSRVAALIRLEDETGPLTRLGYTNFYTITRYNRSVLYAMAVYELSRMIRINFEANP